MTYCSTPTTLEPSATVRWPLWMAIFIVGGVFFFVGHDLFTSQFEDFAPWSDDGVKVSGGNLVKGLSLTLIAGIYGMNFAHMPELQASWGYPVTMGAMFAIAVGQLWFFHKRGWLG